MKAAAISMAIRQDRLTLTADMRNSGSLLMTFSGFRLVAKVLNTMQGRNAVTRSFESTPAALSGSIFFFIIAKPTAMNRNKMIICCSVI